MEDIEICAISDLHGHLPQIPPCSILLIGGDICPCRFGLGYMSDNDTAMHQSFWLKDVFGPWLESLPVKHVVATWGNHDWVGEKKPNTMPKLPWHILVDEGIELLGLKIYGSPWQTRFFDWAFNADEPFMENKWAAIPNDTDILLLHGPPHGYGDLAPVYQGIRDNEEHTGSPSLTKRIMEIKPQLVVCGHIHRSRGVFLAGNTSVANVSIVNERYELVNEPMMFTFKNKKLT